MPRFGDLLYAGIHLRTEKLRIFRKVDRNYIMLLQRVEGVAPNGNRPTRKERVGGGNGQDYIMLLKMGGRDWSRAITDEKEEMAPSRVRLTSLAGSTDNIENDLPFRIIEHRRNCPKILSICPSTNLHFTQ